LEEAGEIIPTGPGAAKPEAWERTCTGTVIHE
jgi:hypothetical protein